MIARFAIAVVSLLTTSSAFAETLTADAARRFVAGKLFAFNCFDGSRGAGRIYADGSVIGNIQFRGAGPIRNRYGCRRERCGSRARRCARRCKGMPFEPCFNLDKTNDQSFRGSVSGFGFAYCDFTRRVSVAAGISGRRQPSAPVELGTAEASAAGSN